jgi:hypothetical protein
MCQAGLSLTLRQIIVQLLTIVMLRIAKLHFMVGIGGLFLRQGRRRESQWGNWLGEPYGLRKWFHVEPLSSTRKRLGMPGPVACKGAQGKTGICGHKKTGSIGRILWVRGVFRATREYLKTEYWSGRRESNPRHELGKLR